MFSYALLLCCWAIFFQFVVLLCSFATLFYHSIVLLCYSVLLFYHSVSQFATTKSDFDSLHEDATVLRAKNKERLIRFTLQDFSFSLLLCIPYLFVSGCCLTHAY